MSLALCMEMELDVSHGREELFVSRLDTDMSWSEVHADAGDPQDLQAGEGEGQGGTQAR